MDALGPLTAPDRVDTLTAMSVDLQSPDMVAYRAAARARDAVRRTGLEARRAQCLRIAEQGADLLRTRYSATRVVLFGSTLRASAFHERSDLDLAVWGLTGPAYWAALAALEELDPTVSIDLVRVETARPSLVAVIESGGVVL